MRIIVKPCKAVFWHFVITDDNTVQVFESKTFFDKPGAIHAARVAADFLLQGHGQIEVVEPNRGKTVTSHNTKGGKLNA